MSSSNSHRRVLGRVKPEDFIGRKAELERIITHAGSAPPGDGLLILLAPEAGISELLRQSYDALFNAQSNCLPIYFSLRGHDNTPVSAAIEFLNSFLTQYIAFRTNDYALPQASLTLNELVQLAPTSDLDWIERLIVDYEKQRFGNDDRQLIRLCMTAPRRAPRGNLKPHILFDAVKLGSYQAEGYSFGAEVINALKSSGSFALAGLRREIVAEVEDAGVDSGAIEKLRVEPLSNDAAKSLVASMAQLRGVAVTDEVRDLMAYQLDGSPFLINALLQAAAEKRLALNSYFDFERLYVDEILGGRLQNYFSERLEQPGISSETRSGIIRVLNEALPAGQRATSLRAWTRRLLIEPSEVESIVQRLHAQEIINLDGDNIYPQQATMAWRDFVRSRFRLDALREPRALVVADLMSDALKRAPNTIAKTYRRGAQLPLRQLLDRFDMQSVPAVLFDYRSFAAEHKGAPDEETAARLELDNQILKLPQIFHTASAAAFDSSFKALDEESCIVAHGFDGATYTSEHEIVWLAAKIDSKLEVDEATAASWCKRLEGLAKRAGFVRTQLWLIANEGFSAEALSVLKTYGAYSSSREQFDLLTTRLAIKDQPPTQANNEFMFVLPMGSDNELLAAATAEQLARRLNFRPEAINQIKTAVVEACINAFEHSISPDRKIYQRFRVEDDKLVVTISSRGVLPGNLATNNSDANAGQRRGWGLKLIKTLMDEVEFERVDEGTSLRMVKYLRK